MNNLPLLTKWPNTPEAKMTKIPFLSQNPVISNKIHTETNNHIQEHTNTHNN